jgi:cytosine/adenosine deaminase-related metal-dependent hydrolase
VERGLDNRQEQEHDLVLTGGRVIDPETGLDAVRAVGIRDGAISWVGERVPPAPATVDVTGMVVAPGFIDLHSHPQNLVGMRLQALDGVTTALELEAGALPVGVRYREAEQEGRPINFGYSAAWLLSRMHLLDGVEPGPALAVDHASQHLTNWRRPIQGDQLRALLDLIERNIHEGALGIGLLLGYAPDTSRAEFLAVSALAERLGVPTFTHARYMGPSEPGSSLEGALELVAAGAATGAQMHVCHLNSTSDRMIDQVAAAVEQARRSGVRLTTEAYPYGAGSTSIGAPFLAPEKLSERGLAPSAITYLATGERVRDAARLEQLRAQDPGGLIIIDFLREDDEADRATLLRSLLLADTAIATDAMPVVRDGAPLRADEWPPPPGARVHPRSVGGYARTLRWLVRELGVLSLPEAVRRCSLLPAQILADAAPAMSAKGRVQVGADADIVVFDADAVTDRATYTEIRPSAGIEHVLVAGTFVVRHRELVLSALPGRPVYGRHR